MPHSAHYLFDLFLTTDGYYMLHCRHTTSCWYALFILWYDCCHQPSVTGKFWL